MSTNRRRARLVFTWWTPLAAAALLLALPQVASAQAEALRLGQLEQDVRDLQRLVTAQQRRLDALEAAGGVGTHATAVPATGRGTGATPPGAAPPIWVDSSRWRRVQPGLSELDVVALLGPPTSLRASDDGRRRTLYYALEIGTSAFLAGNVVIDDRRVSAVEPPALR